MRHSRWLILGLGLAFAVIACGGFGDAADDNHPAAAAPATTPAADAAPPPPSIVVTDPPKLVATCGSDCDTTAGMGCCLSGAGSCISQSDYASACPTGGVFVGCFQPTTDSNCCWHDLGGSRVALAAAICKDGYACLVDTDCPSGTGTCAKTTCHGVDIGQCGSAPACP